MITIRKAERADNATVVGLWHHPSYKVTMPNAVQDGLPPDRLRLASTASSMIKAGGLHLIMDGDSVVGTINRFGSEGRPEIGWFVAEAHRNRGIATEALTLFVSQLFEQGAQEVRFGTFADNHACIRVAEKLGLVPTQGAVVPGAHVEYRADARGWSDALTVTATRSP